MFTIRKIQTFIEIFSICSKPIWFSWLIHKLWHCTVLRRVSPYVPVALVVGRLVLQLGNIRVMVCSYGGVCRRMHGQSHLQIICIYTWSSYSGHVSNSLGKTLTFFKKMSMEKCRFWVLTFTVLVHNEGFHNKFLLNSCTFLFNFLFSRSKFSYTLCVSWVIKQTCEICDTISNKKYEKLRNYSSQRSSI